MTEENTFEYWDDKLKENKARYTAGELLKEEYQKNGRRIRAKRRKAVKSGEAKIRTASFPHTETPPPGPKSLISPKRKRKKSKKTKATTRVIGFGEQNEYYRKLCEAFQILNQTESLESKPIDFDTSAKSKPREVHPKDLHNYPYQAFPISEVMRLGLSTHAEVALNLISRFQDKWLLRPEFYSAFRQGEMIFVCLGPVEGKHKRTTQKIDQDSSLTATSSS